MEVIAQLVVDFVAEYGILAAIVFGLIWDSGKRLKAQSKVMQGMLDNQAQETRQQDRLITQNGLAISKVSRLEDLFAKWIETHTAENSKKNTIIETGIASIDKNTEGVNIVKTELENVLSEIAAMRTDMQQLITTVNEATNEIKNMVNSKTSEYEGRMNLFEESVKKITQEAPAIVAVEEIKHLQATETEEKTDKVKTITTEKESKS